ncbi:hypothetical protein LY76DRAFT_586474 [Colletotrichum caudatum]|nr:hypothetical protein LY76DRAFT_586474 [Colletotrichum caudatum]
MFVQAAFEAENAGPLGASTVSLNSTFGPCWCQPPSYKKAVSERRGGRAGYGYVLLLLLLIPLPSETLPHGCWTIAGIGRRYRLRLTCAPLSPDLL